MEEMKAGRGEGELGAGIEVEWKCPMGGNVNSKGEGGREKEMVVSKGCP